MFLRNCWYVAAWSAEIGREPLARTFLAEPVMLYRTAAGRVIALEDRCCHRNLPLSMGMIEGDDVRCGYHGLKFDQDGRCIEVPGQESIPPGAKVRTYPIVERWNLAWIWMGEAARADEKLLPDWSVMEAPGWAVIQGNDAKPMHMKCSWELNNDNLLDLSHVAYVHAKTLGGKNTEKFPVETERLERGVRMTRWMPGVAPIPMWKKYLSGGGDMDVVDRWQVTETELPGHCAVDAGFAPAGKVAKDGERGHYPRLRVLISATPETETSSFMFFAQIRNFGVDDEHLDRHFRTDSRNVFVEDVVIMEAQQRAILARPGASTVNIRSDAPHLAMRQLLQRSLAEEMSR